MKILIVRTFPDIINLNSYNVQEIGLARALNLKGHQCDIVLYGGKRADYREKYSFEQDGVACCFHIFWLRGFSILKNGFMPSVNKLIDKYDVIQVHEYDQIQSFLIYRKCKKPTVIYHGPYYHPYAKGYNLKCRIFDLFFLHGRRYKQVPALTKSVPAKEFLESKGFLNVKAVGVGLNEKNFKENPEDEKLVPDAGKDVFRILYIGKIEDRRNTYFLVDILRELIIKNYSAELVIIGSGEEGYRRAFLASIEKELKDRTVIYCKSASQTQLSEIYKGADLFLFTSNYEIFGMVLLEAMYFGLPVISSVNGGAATLIRQGINGYMMDGFCLEEWVGKIVQLLKDGERLRAMGRSAQETVKESYLWSSLSARFVETYREAVGREKFYDNAEGEGFHK